MCNGSSLVIRLHINVTNRISKPAIKKTSKNRLTS